MMRIGSLGLATAMLIGLAWAPPALAQRNLPSDVEERLGLPPNAMNPGRHGGRYRPLPSDVEQRMRRRAHRQYRDYDDDDDRRSYRRARQYPGYGYPYPY